MCTRFERRIERHWREHRLQMVKALESQGLLTRAIQQAAERTIAAESSLMQQGVRAPEAEERMREEWAFLPSEEDLPDLPNGHPVTWLPPRTSSWSADIELAVGAERTRLATNLAGIEIPNRLDAETRRGRSRRASELAGGRLERP
jgi:hypothetical protein